MPHPLGRVLLIEDDPDIAAILSLGLPAMGAAGVTLVTDGAAGLARGLSDRYDLVLVDLLLPGLDGFEVVRGLRARWTSEETAIVFLTSASRSMDQRVLRKLGADGLIRKPVTLTDLATQLQAIFSARPAPRA